MKANSHRITKRQLKRVCASPELGCMLGDYVLNLLDDSTAEEVEDHFLYCSSCREKYLAVLTIVGVVDDEDPDVLDGRTDLPVVEGTRKVISLAGYRRART